MLTEPRDLDRAETKGRLEQHWGLRRVRLEYLPVGFGSHHWKAIDSRGERWFVTIDDLAAGFQAGPDTNAAFDALERAFRTAAALRDEARLDFVHGPLLDNEGKVIRRVSERYALTVSPFIEGKTGSWGRYESAAERREMAGILGRLHVATEQVPADLPRREDFGIPSRAALTAALADLERSWSTGPFAEPTRRLLQDHSRGIHRRLAEYDELVARVRESSTEWVVTHGEPHRGNVIHDTGGGVHLVDWDTTKIAPRERDWRMVLDQDDEGQAGWDEYLAADGGVALDQDAMDLYRRRWDLADICAYVALFRHTHELTEDASKSFRGLRGYLSN